MITFVNLEKISPSPVSKSYIRHCFIVLGTGNYCQGKLDHGKFARINLARGNLFEHKLIQGKLGHGKLIRTQTTPE